MRERVLLGGGAVEVAGGGAWMGRWRLGATRPPQHGQLADGGESGKTGRSEWRVASCCCYDLTWPRGETRGGGGKGRARPKGPERRRRRARHAGTHRPRRRGGAIDSGAAIDLCASAPASARGAAATVSSERRPAQLAPGREGLWPPNLLKMAAHRGSV